MSVGSLTDGEVRSRKQKRPRIILVYAIVGPPVGGLIAYASLFIAAAIRSGLSIWLQNLSEEPLLTLLDFVGGLIFIPLMGYGFGGVQAFLTGALISFIAGKKGRFGFGLAILAPTLVALAVGGVLTGFYQIRTGYTFFEAPMFLGVIGVAASVVVRILFRKRFSPKFAEI